MSGTNPFRRGTPAASSTNHPGPAGPLLRAIDTEVTETSTKKSKTTKTVRIISPHSADASTGSFPQSLITPPANISGHGGYVGEEDNSTDSAVYDEINPFSNDSGPGTRHVATEEEHRPRETQRPAPRPLRSSMKQITTSAPSQASAGGSQEIPIQQGGAGAGSDTTKQQHDVDRFTKLLLSGRKNSTPTAAAAPPPVTFQGSSNAPDNSSNTDASSISRQSLFDSIFEARHETPKSSHDASPSEEAGIVLPASPLARSGSIRPPVPRARHGKPLDDTRSSVPFQDSAPVIEKPLKSPPIEKEEPSPSPRTPTDLNKPLPAPPRPRRSSINADDGRVSANPEIAEKSADVLASEPSGPVRSQAVPPPPPVRRLSQRRPKSFVGNPSQPETINEDHQSESNNSTDKRSATDPIQENVSIIKPPPPPPRRTRSTRSDSKSSISSARSIPSIPERFNSSNDVLSSSPVKSPPPLPPSRQPGSASSKRGSRPIGGNLNPAFAPPPPPRMRGSSQSSTNSSILSGDYRSSLSANDRRNSGSSSTLQSSDHAPDRRPSDEKDVMADLTTLQREVDELRGKLGR